MRINRSFYIVFDKFYVEDNHLTCTIIFVDDRLMGTAVMLINKKYMKCSMVVDFGYSLL